MVNRALSRVGMDGGMARLREISASLLLVAALLCAWQGACALLALPTYLLPTPMQVGWALVQDGPELAASAWATLWMALMALALAAAVALPLALVTGLSRWAERAVRPLAVTLQVTPVVAMRRWSASGRGSTTRGGPSWRWRRWSPSSRCSRAPPRACAQPTRTWSACSTSTAPRVCSAWRGCRLRRPRPMCSRASRWP